MTEQSKMIQYLNLSRLLIKQLQTKAKLIKDNNCYFILSNFGTEISMCYNPTLLILVLTFSWFKLHVLYEVQLFKITVIRRIFVCSETWRKKNEKEVRCVIKKKQIVTSFINYNHSIWKYYKTWNFLGVDYLKYLPGQSAEWRY